MAREKHRVLVCGGRNYHDFDRARTALDLAHNERAIDVLVCGMAQGADMLAVRWANAKGVTVLPFPADWKRYGPPAGPIRNQRMIDEGRPNLVLAFAGGAGTKDMVTRAERASIPVIYVNPL